MTFPKVKFVVFSAIALIACGEMFGAERVQATACAGGQCAVASASSGARPVQALVNVVHDVVSVPVHIVQNHIQGGQCYSQPVQQCCEQPVQYEQCYQPVVQCCQQPVYQQPCCQQSTGSYAYASASGRRTHVSAGVGSPSDVGQGTAAYAHALREAQLQASRGRHGHLLGVAPGAGMQGVGMSHSGNDPSHCTGRGLIARAGVQGADGRWYWSAAYQR